MRRFITAVAVTAILIGPVALAAEDQQTSQPGEAATTPSYTGTTTSQAQMPQAGTLASEKVAIMPQVGTLVYKDTLGNSTGRAAYGVLAEGNVVNWFSNQMPYLFIGPQVGAIFSHLGAPDSNFFGTNSDIAADTGSNFLLIPTNIMVGYNLNDNFRLGVHAGGNVIYRSVADAMNLGSKSLGTGTSWVYRPDVGLDVDFGVAKNVALSLRPDLTITSGDELFTGTLALSVPIG